MAKKPDHEVTRPDGPPIPAGDAAKAVPAVQAEVDAFVAALRRQPSPTTTARGRLIFAMDATMSRQPTWDLALTLQGDMFEAVRQVGQLDVQLVYFRGFGECRASRWVGDPRELARLMTTVDCRGGNTQIGKLLSHARAETARRRVNALVFVGDAMEEQADDLCARAGELGVLGVPVFLFQEGGDQLAERTFREIARLTRGAWCRFDPGSAAQLRALLSAVAVYASGGRRALEALAARDATGAVKMLTRQLG